MESICFIASLARADSVIISFWTHRDANVLANNAGCRGRSLYLDVRE